MDNARATLQGSSDSTPATKPARNPAKMHPIELPQKSETDHQKEIAVKPELVIPGQDSKDTDDLMRMAAIRRYPRNTIVVSEGDDTDSVYFIVSGTVKVFLSDSKGNEVVIGMLKAGDSFGEMALEPGTRSASVMATEALCLAVVRIDDFRAFLMTHPACLYDLLRKLIRRTRLSNRNLKSLALMDVYGRLVQLLGDMAEEVDGRRIIANLPTQKELASRIGCSREMVNKILRDLTTGDYLRINRRSAEILRHFPASW